MLQPRLLGGCKRLQITCDLMVMRRDQDQAFALRAPLEFEDALYRQAVIRIAAQSVAGLGRISYKAAALEMRCNSTR